MRTEMSASSELVDTILARTREGKLTWEELSQTGFLTRVGQTMIIIDQVRGGPALRITDDSGKVLEGIASPVFSQDGKRELLSDLYELARRQALRVEDTLSELKRRLDRL
jgi:hypothetical protein